MAKNLVQEGTADASVRALSGIVQGVIIETQPHF